MSEPAVAEVTVHPGKLTWLPGSFGDERFDRAFSAGAVGHDYALQVHALLLSTDVEDGRRVIIPGVATQWEISPDGLTWTFTIRDGIKFHDGTDLTAEDALWTFQHLMGPQTADYTIAGLDKYIQNIDRIEQTGPNQVSVTTKLLSPNLLRTCRKQHPLGQAQFTPNGQSYTTPRKNRPTTRTPSALES